jgi:asparagine synthase (glutamine-hydrolysing)
VCGIAGVLNLNGELVAEEKVLAMAKSMAHRGPDDEGTFCSGGVGLAHRRLAIIDLSPAGHQPMFNEDGTVAVVYSGELYNYLDLRPELEAAGHRFRSHSDTEVLVHGWEQWGPQCLDRFNGHFALAIWDARARRLFLARDRFGTKPLYYLFDGLRLAFGSEVKAILTLDGVPRRVSAPALNEYFTFQNVLTDLTLFEGVRLLPSGCWLSIDAAPGARPEQKKYWDYRIPSTPVSISEDEAAEELYRLFTQAVTRQLMSDVPIGCYLSGGMDSGSITAVARARLGRLMSFTGGFDMSSASGLELGFDEREQSEALANLLKTEHYEMVMHAGDMEAVMPKLIWHLEDLRVGQSYPNYYMARLAGKFVKVVLSGAGGDELFGGYPWRYYRALGLNGADFARRYYGFWQRLVPDEDKSSLFQADTFESINGHSTFDVFAGVLAESDISIERHEDCINASLYFELKTFLHGLLVVEDKLSFAHGLETRMPFLDNDLVDFAMRIPVRLKLRNIEQLKDGIDEDDVLKMRRFEYQTRDGKMILRRAMERIIPEEVTTRRKQGFSAPDASWFRGESIDYINGLLRDPEARIYQYLQPCYVRTALDEHTEGKVNHRLFIWSLLSVEWWLRNFME